MLGLAATFLGTWVRSTRETLLDPPYLRSFHSPRSITTPIPIGTSCKHGDRREGDRSVSSPSSPDGLPLPVPLLQLQLARPPTTTGLTAPELYHRTFTVP
ncbi:hypothetical protein FJTKL_12227 [Diaporthe vaccinii]|uniref:Secreted protein n=1 Tax=Diaporthe vaccinii TaxID=105482 RepID=A0ABR4EEV0_9PEZI